MGSCGDGWLRFVVGCIGLRGSSDVAFKGRERGAGNLEG